MQVSQCAFADEAMKAWQGKCIIYSCRSSSVTRSMLTWTASTLMPSLCMQIFLLLSLPIDNGVTKFGQKIREISMILFDCNYLSLVKLYPTAVITMQVRPVPAHGDAIQQSPEMRFLGICLDSNAESLSLVKGLHTFAVYCHRNLPRSSLSCNYFPESDKILPKYISG